MLPEDNWGSLAAYEGAVGQLGQPSRRLRAAYTLCTAATLSHRVVCYTAMQWMLPARWLTVEGELHHPSLRLHFGQENSPAVLYLSHVTFFCSEKQLETVESYLSLLSRRLEG